MMYDLSVWRHLNNHIHYPSEMKEGEIKGDKIVFP
jgi:hypothetical protein